MNNYIKNNTGILIRIDDVCENMDWELMKKLELLFDQYSVKPVLGVIPNNKDEEFLAFSRNDNFWDQVRKWQDKGWVLVQHGYTHIYDKLCRKKSDYFNYGGGSEFFGHSLETQETRIKKGLEKFKKEEIVVNNVLLLEINTMGLLQEKKLLNIKDMKNLKFSEKVTESQYKKDTFVYDFLSSMRQKINDPLDKRRR